MAGARVRIRQRDSNPQLAVDLEVSGFHWLPRNGKAPTTALKRARATGYKNCGTSLYFFPMPS